MRRTKVFEKFSLLPYGLRYKLIIAFGLMSIIPLLVIGYLINNVVVLGEALPLSQLTLIALFCIVIAWLGLFLAKSIIERVIDVSLESQLIAEGNYERRITIEADDEVGQLGEAVNFLTKKIRDNLSDLKDYQGTIKDINMEIQKRVLVLSSLLQIGELISSSVDLKSVTGLILSKLSQLMDGGFAALYMSKSVEDKDILSLVMSERLENKKLLDVVIEKGKGFLGKAITQRKRFLMDASSKFSSEAQAFRVEYKCENIIAFPMMAAGEKRIFLIVGNNNKNYTYTNDDMEILRVFAEQLLIAIENDMLLKKAEKLEIKDEATGLFNRTYMVDRLKEEIERSIHSHRPCSFITIDIDGFMDYRNKNGQAESEILLRKIARMLSELSAPLGRACRIINDTFGLIAPETNKKHALLLADKIRKKIEATDFKRGKVTVSCGVSENPLDGSDINQIIDKAKTLLAKAKKSGKNKIEG